MASTESLGVLTNKTDVRFNSNERRFQKESKATQHANNAQPIGKFPDSTSSYVAPEIR
jgi:hypothetical protein